ncbi:MAG TPA: hypothetical protein P5277_00130 [Candidatus Paceibacterota bacterium]|nr:hypothetical protein [Candidatus Paceibacterota bacterium]
MKNNFEDYKATIQPKPELIPYGYKPCPMLGRKAFCEVAGLVSCRISEGYCSNLLESTISNEEEDKPVHICKTKGLVEILDPYQ